MPPYHSHVSFLLSRNLLLYYMIPTHENFRHASHNYRFPLLVVCLSWKQNNIFSSLLKFLEEVLSNLLREIKSCFCSVLIKNIIEVIAASVFWPYSSKYFKIFDVQCKPHKDKMQWHFKEAQLSQTKQIRMQERKFCSQKKLFFFLVQELDTKTFQLCTFVVLLQ